MVQPPVDIPHHTQLEEFTCGPAAMKMVLDGFVGLSFPEPMLAAHMETDPDIGTRQRMMHRFADDLGLATYVRHTDTTVDEIRQAMQSGHAVIVCYWLTGEDTDHYAVVSAIHSDSIDLHDPWEGPDTKMDLTTFDADWYGDDNVPGRRHRWMLAIKPKEA